jgi:hypothetical protein
MKAIPFTGDTGYLHHGNAFKGIFFPEPKIAIVQVTVDGHLDTDHTSYQIWPAERFPEDFGSVIGTPIAMPPEGALYKKATPVRVLDMEQNVYDAFMRQYITLTEKEKTVSEAKEQERRERVRMTLGIDLLLQEEVLR